MKHVLVLLLFSLFAHSQPKVISVELLQSLSLGAPLETGRLPHVSAASGIVERDGKYFIISDDEFGIFSTNGKTQLKPYMLKNKKLGSDQALRKKRKPDFESLLLLDKDDWPPEGAIVAWPSASTLDRMSAAIFILNKSNEIESSQTVDILSFSYLLAKQVGDLNIEGILRRENQLFLFQRGNSKNGKSGYFEVAFSDWLLGIKNNKWPKKISFHKVKVGKLNGVKLTLADGVWTDYGLLGLAPAEATQSTYSDGKTQGTALVRISGSKAEVIGLFEGTRKFEGMIAKKDGKGLELLLVDDSDDPTQPAHLYRAKLTSQELTTFKK